MNGVRMEGGPQDPDHCKGGADCTFALPSGEVVTIVRLDETCSGLWAAPGPYNTFLNLGFAVDGKRKHAHTLKGSRVLVRDAADLARCVRLVLHQSILPELGAIAAAAPGGPGGSAPAVDAGGEGEDEGSDSSDCEVP